MNPWLIVAAHPDDEAIGASWFLGRVATVVVHVTDGAPRDPRLWSPRAPGGRESYGLLREDEARRALTLAGLGPGQVRQLGFVDQEVVHELAPLARALHGLFEELDPVGVIAQPYEGGHPDHDACAFATRAALALRRASAGRAPPLVEMTAYHRRNGALRTGVFLHGGPPELERRLTPGERMLKKRMLACFESQAEVLRPFTLNEERFRRAPRYQFTRPPHPGPLHYETLGWPMRADWWCGLAGQALVTLGLSE